MLKRSTWPAGTVHRLELDSALLVGNRPGDPTRRPVLVYTPPGYDASRRLPLMVDLVGYTGSGASHTNWRPFSENLPERLDRLHAEGRIGDVVVALPDCFTAYGGNQYIDSPGTGPYMRHLVEEVVPFVEAHFPILPGRDHRALLSKTSASRRAATGRSSTASSGPTSGAPSACTRGTPASSTCSSPRWHDWPPACSTTTAMSRRCSPRCTPSPSSPVTTPTSS